MGDDDLDLFHVGHYRATTTGISSRMSEMACNPALPDALVDELLPWVRTHCGVTDDPSRVVICGQNFGGLAGAWITFRRPDAFGGALSISSSF